MAEYIEREALKKHIASYAGMFTDELGFVVSLQAVLNGIDFAPAANVVEVVRCKDCKYAYMPPPKRKNAEWCAWHETEVGNDDFCSYGERRSE